MDDLIPRSWLRVPPESPKGPVAVLGLAGEWAKFDLDACELRDGTDRGGYAIDLYRTPCGRWFCGYRRRGRGPREVPACVPERLLECDYAGELTVRPDAFWEVGPGAAAAWCGENGHVPAPTLILGDLNHRPIVRGNEKKALTLTQYAAVKPLYEAHPRRLKTQQLRDAFRKIAGALGDPVQALKGLRRSDEDWAATIVMAVDSHHGYGVNR